MIKRLTNRRNDKAISTLANNIIKYRKMNNMTIQELANLVDVDYSQISRMERGIVNPTISIISDVATALKITTSQLLE